MPISCAPIPGFLRTDETLAGISRDCICCTLRRSTRHSPACGGEGRFNYPLVEPTEIRSLPPARSVPLTARRRTGMTVLREDPAGSLTGIAAAVDAADELPAFLQPDCPALIWRRHPSPCFSKVDRRVRTGTATRARVILPPKNVAEATSLIRQLQYAGRPAKCHAGGRYRPSGTGIRGPGCVPRFLRLRYDGVGTNACRRFTSGVVTARLICTRGRAIQAGSRNTATPIPRTSIPSQHCGSAILLRGKLWPESPGTLAPAPSLLLREPDRRGWSSSSIQLPTPTSTRNPNL